MAASPWQRFAAASMIYLMSVVARRTGMGTGQGGLGEDLTGLEGGGRRLAHRDL